MCGAIIPHGAQPPSDCESFPVFIWTTSGDTVPGRVEEIVFSSTCMACIISELDLAELKTNSNVTFETPSFEEVGRMNERAYITESETALGDIKAGIFVDLLKNICDPCIKTHGLRERHGGSFVCVAVTVTIGDHVGIHYIVTEKAYRRRGFASKLIHGILVQARDDGICTASVPIMCCAELYEKLGFRKVATMRGFYRPAFVAQNSRTRKTSHPDDL